MKQEIDGFMRDLELRMKPPHLDGKTSWTNYLLLFEVAARANSQLPVENVTALTLALRDEATDVLQTLSPKDRGDFVFLLNT